MNNNKKEEIPVQLAKGNGKKTSRENLNFLRVSIHFIV